MFPRTLQGEIAPLLSKLSRETVDEEGRYPIPDDVEIETRIAQQEMEAEELIASVEKLGRVSRLTCPDCHGAQEVRRAIDTCFHEHTTMTLPEIELDQSSEGSGRYVSLRTAVRES